jgi:hypothetical protein
VTVFRKKRRQDDADPDDVDALDDAGRSYDDVDQDAPEIDELDGDEDLDTGERPARSTAAPGEGPYDVGDLDDPSAGGARVDLGGVWIPGRPGLEVRIEADQTTSEVVAVTLVLGDSALQVQPFAAPRTEGIWDDVRTEIRSGITQQGGTVDEAEGPLGPELRSRVPVRAADGSQAVQPARFVGVDGPRWFLRGVITGRAAVEPGTDAELVAIFRDVVVVRGANPMAPREAIPLRLPPTPAEVAPDDGSDDSDDSAASAGGRETSSRDLKPFERGPEITEIR